jgi:hypothetical protein
LSELWAGMTMNGVLQTAWLIPLLIWHDFDALSVE